MNPPLVCLDRSAAEIAYSQPESRAPHKIRTIGGGLIALRAKPLCTLQGAKPAGNAEPRRPARRSIPIRALRAPQRVKSMTANTGGPRHKLLTRVVATAAMVAIYCLGTIATSGVFLTASTTSAEAARGRGRGWRGRGYGRRGWGRRGWRGRGWYGRRGFYGRRGWRGRGWGYRPGLCHWRYYSRWRACW
jgi:hypothetical protein